MAACISPESIAHPYGTKRSVRISVPCGKCLNCFQNRRSDWTLRLLEELRISRTAKFITLTYSEEMVPRKVINGKVYMELDKEAIKAFLKRLRTRVDRYYQSKGDNSIEKALRRPMRYYLVGEYGARSYRPHYHAIFFNLPKNFNRWLLSAWYVENGGNKYEAGFVHVGEVTQASIHYTTKYMLDGLLSTANFSELKDSKGDWIVEAPFSLMSKGIGNEYIRKMASYHRNNEVNHYTMPDGKKKRLPRYYKDKIFNEHEKKYFALKAEEKQSEDDKKRREKGINLYTEYEGNKVNVLKKSKQRKI